MSYNETAEKLMSTNSLHIFMTTSKQSNIYYNINKVNKYFLVHYTNNTLIYYVQCNLIGLLPCSCKK